MTSYTLSPVWGAGAQLFDNSGNVLTGGKIYTYEAGTTTPSATYTDPTGNTFNSNPIIADASGRLSNEIWLPVSGAYKFVLKDTNDVLIATYDNIPTSPPPPIFNDASSISYEQGYTVTAGAFTVGASYRITSVGTTNFVAIGATTNATGILFTATGVGSGDGTAEYSRTVQTKLRETVSVKDFGAVGDGVTDDTVSIQNALNDAAILGAAVYFPFGEYIIRNVLVPANSILFGDKSATLTLKVLAAGDFSPIFTLQGNNTEFNGLVFNGNRPNQPYNPGDFADNWVGRSKRSAIVGDVLSPTVALNGLRVENCEFYEFFGASIATRDMSNVNVLGCYFHDSNFEGAFLYQQQPTSLPHTNASITDCTFINIRSNDSIVNADCIITSGYDGVLVANSYAKNFERLMLKTEVCSNVSFIGNTSIDATLFGGFGAQAGGDNIVVANNIIINSGNAAIGFTGGGSSPLFTNVVVTGNVVDTTGTNVSIGTPDGIQITRCVDIEATNNKLSNVRRHGVYLATEVDGIYLIQNNSISSNTAIASHCGIITITSVAVKALSIIGNTVRQPSASSAGTIAITGDASIPVIESLIVSNNLISGSTGRAMFTFQFTGSGAISNNVSPDGFFEIYNSGTGTLTSINNITPRVIGMSGVNTRLLPNADAAPVAGTYYAGDTVYRLTPVAGGTIGFVCTTGGTPGTWKTFGAIAA